MSNSDSQQTYLNGKRASNPRVPTHRGNKHCIASSRSFTFFCMGFCVPVNEDITVIGVSIPEKKASQSMTPTPSNHLKLCNPQ